MKNVNNVDKEIFQGGIKGFVALLKYLIGKIPKPVLPYLIVFAHTTGLIMLLSPVDVVPLLINCLFFLPVVGILLLLPSYKAVCITESVIMYAIYYTNQFVTSARGRSLHYTDVFCIRDALGVAGRYAPPVSVSIIIVTLLFIAWTFINVWALSKINVHKNIKSVGIAILSMCIPIPMITVMTSANILDTNGIDFHEDTVMMNKGIFYTLYCEYTASKTIPPEGYSAAAVQTAKSKYTAPDAGNSRKPDRIIVIMNEALADFEIIGDPVYEKSPLEKFHSIDDNCIKGEMYVNIFGGTTSNTEFEFLTGCSLSFMPTGSIPYLQYSLKDCGSFAEDSTAEGYHATAVHPYYASGYARNVVYPELGFDTFISGENFTDGFEFKKNPINSSFPFFGDNLTYYRKLVSDKDCYDKIKEIGNAEDKSFIFCVTMQNHGSYGFDFEYDGMREYISETEKTKYDFGLSSEYKELLEGLGQEPVAAANQYLNLVQISDDAFADFLEDLRNSDESTVVVMFGDHEPALEFEYYNKKYSDSGNEYEKFADYFVVPYIMWANYDVEWEQHDKISANYLSAVLKENCGFPLTDFDNVRLAAMKEYPVITEYFAVDSSGEYVNSEEAYTSQTIKDYEIMQYERLDHNANDMSN